MQRIVLGALAVCAGLVAAGAAEARTHRHHGGHRLHEGQACHGMWRGGPQVVKVAGFFMGGRDVRPHLGNPRDTRSFQGCFQTADACQAWQARLSAQYPIGPALRHCVPVVLR